MLIILAAMVRHAFMETGRPSEHDGKDKTIDYPSLFYTFLTLRKM